MGCGNCGTSPRGCNNNGACASGGCNKLNVFDWLSNMKAPGGEVFPWVEVRFKNTRKDFYYNQHNLPLQTGDVVAVEGSPGHDIGVVSLSGELVKLQMKKLRMEIQKEEVRNLFRKARENDIQKWKEAIDKEQHFMMHCRKLAYQLKLNMKVSDVECQGDGTKATFFYTAEGRVDFRELIKSLARDLKVRIEMRQIGYRQEAGRLGGIGVCGRELCCSSWLRDFRSVTTTAARYQQLSINPQKLAGQCGKLKCCLNYELDSYLDALRDFPSNEPRLQTQAGDATSQKTDIFRRVIYYSYVTSPEHLMAVPLERVQEIIRLNKEGKKPEELLLPKAEETVAKPKEFNNVIEEDSLTRFDKARNNKKNNNKRKFHKKPRKNA